MPERRQIVTTPPRHWLAENGESDREAPAPWDSARLLHGVPLDAQPLALYLERRLLGDPGADPQAPPDIPAFEVVAAAVHALREAIMEAGERGLAAGRVRTLHAGLDRELARLFATALARRTDDSRTLLRDVSHDLRSPLNSILFLADALASGHSGELNDVQRRQVGVLYAAAVSLVGLVNDLIDVTRLGDATTIEVVAEPFSLESVLQQVEQLVGPLATPSGTGLAFRLETLGPRRGDRRILTRILINLVTNAVQATGQGGRVVVRALDAGDGGLRVTVTDSGNGADVEQLRERLSESPLPTSESRGHGWTHGLGLAICTRLARAAGGTIDVARSSDGGCILTVDLPFPRD